MQPTVSVCGNDHTIITGNRVGGSIAVGCGITIGSTSQTGTADEKPVPPQPSVQWRVRLSQSDRDSLRRQLHERKESLRIIQERKAATLPSTDVPMSLLKEELFLERQIRELLTRLYEHNEDMNDDLGDG